MLQCIHTHLMPIKTLFKIEYESQARGAMDTVVAQDLQRTGASLIRPGIASVVPCCMSPEYQVNLPGILLSGSQNKLQIHMTNLFQYTLIQGFKN